MASVTVRKRGNKWCYRFECAMIDGKRKQHERGGFSTKKEALAAGAKALSEYNNTGLHFTPSEMSFSDYLDYWIENYCKVNLKETTVVGYKKKINNTIKPALGAYKLRALSPATLQDFINDVFNDGYARNTLTVIKGILSSCLNYAVEPLNFIQSSPMIYVKLPSKRAKAAKPTRLHARTIVTKTVMQKILERFPEGSSPYIPLMLGYHCGLRLGEAFALRWEDVNFDLQTLTVNHQVQHINGAWTFTKPKYDSIRTIRLDGKMLDALKREKKRQIEGQLRAGSYYRQQLENEYHQINEAKGIPINLVMVRANEGSYIQPRVMMDASRVIHGKNGKKAISETFDFHSLRHTHATMLLEAGANPKAVQQRLGHKNINVTLQIYAHSTERMETEAVSILESIV